MDRYKPASFDVEGVMMIVDREVLTEQPLSDTLKRIRKAHKAYAENVSCNLRKDGWISVEDRLPEEQERVLVYDHVEGEGQTVYEAKRVNGRWIWANSVWVTHGITHWMPLPSPPDTE